MITRMIAREDYLVIKNIAKKYNMSIGDFGRTIVRQAEQMTGRTIRLSEEEHKYITDKAKENNMAITRFCALACKAYINLDSDSIPIEKKSKLNKTKRIEVRLDTGADEIELKKLSTKYSMKMSTMIRYCALHFDGKKINI